MLYIIFHILIMGSSFLALNVQFGGFFQIFWKIFKIKVTWMFGSCKVGSYRLGAKPLVRFENMNKVISRIVASIVSAFFWLSNKWLVKF